MDRHELTSVFFPVADDLTTGNDHLTTIGSIFLSFLHFIVLCCLAEKSEVNSVNFLSFISLQCGSSVGPTLSKCPRVRHVHIGARKYLTFRGLTFPIQFSLFPCSDIYKMFYKD